MCQFCVGTRSSIPRFTASFKRNKLFVLSENIFLHVKKGCRFITQIQCKEVGLNWHAIFLTCTLAFFDQNG